MADDKVYSPKTAQYWVDAVKKAGKNQRDDWEQKADGVIRRYRDERKSLTKDSKQFNILWSNTETLKPALYSNMPKPNVIRRFKDRDPVARTASMILERAVDFSLDNYDFDAEARKCIIDYLLPGRATIKVIYKPTYGEEEYERIPLTENNGLFMSENGGMVDGEQAENDENGYFMRGQPYTPVADEAVLCEYVYWKDFRTGPARCWGKMPWVAYRSYMGRKELIDRFGEKKGRKPSLNMKEKSDSENENENPHKDKAEIWEIWDKESKKVRWISLDYADEFLEVSDPPINFKEFFNCPEPLLSVYTNESMVPIPEYCMYEDQAKEIDNLTQRISLLIKALKVAGAYPGSQEKNVLGRLLTEASENMLIPVDDWAMFAERGGLNGMISWLPIEQIINVVVRLYESREQTKQELYEITGLADIIRGASKASETATAQRIKGQFASLRLSDRQQQVNKFIRDIIRLKAEVIAEQFSPQTLTLMTGIQATPEVMELLQNDVLRGFKIDIETDSTIMADEQADKESRIEFITAVSQFFEQIMPMAQTNPQMVPLFGELILYGVRGFKAGKQLENSLEQALEQLQQAAQQQANQPPPPDPKTLEAQAKVQEKQQDMQMKAAEFQQDSSIKQSEHQMDQAQQFQKMILDRVMAENKEA